MLAEARALLSVPQSGVNAGVIKLWPECQVTTQAQVDSAACAPGKSTSRGGNATRAGSKMSPAYQNLCKRRSAFGMPLRKTRSDQERVAHGVNS